MDQPEVKEPLATSSASDSNVPPPQASAARPAANWLAPQACPTCGFVPPMDSGAAATASFVYAIGRIEPRFPRSSVEKEFAQATGRAETAGLTDRQAVQKVLSPRQNRYLARQLCWVMTIEGLETYILVPRDPADLDLLIEALRSTPSPIDLDCVIGVRGLERGTALRIYPAKYWCRMAPRPAFGDALTPSIAIATATCGLAASAVCIAFMGQHSPTLLMRTAWAAMLCKSSGRAGTACCGLARPQVFPFIQAAPFHRLRRHKVRTLRI
jgi:PatG Domain